MALSEIVSVAIQAGTVNPARRGFGTPLLLMFHDAWAGDEVRSYTGYASVAADFSATDADQRHVTLAAAAMFSQSPRPTTIKIGRLPTPGTGQVTTIDANDMETGADIVGSVVHPNGDATAINVAWNTDLATTLADLRTALTAIADLTAGAASGGVLAATCDTPGRSFFYSFETAGVDVRDTTADWDYDDRLTALLNVDPDFYGIVVENNSPKNMDKVARWALANDRMAGFGPQYTKPAQFASGEFTSGADYTALLANDAAWGLVTAEPRSTFKEAAWFSNMFPRDPGSATWAYKPLAGIGADVWTPSQRATIEGYSANHYAAEAAIGITRPGTMFGGEWIDVVHGLAWLEARLQERLFALLVNNPKIPYTDAGFALLVAEVSAQLTEAESKGVLDAGWTVTITPVASQATADRAARIVRGLEFEARLAGAVHTINVVGTVTV